MSEQHPHRPAHRGDPSLLRSQPPPCAVMFDFDGTLIDMSPFSAELRTASPDRWRRFSAHTPQAKPVTAGLNLLNRVDALGWQYTVSTTRPARARELVTDWLAAHRPLSGNPPAEVLFRKKGMDGLGPAVEHKVRHARRRQDSNQNPLVTVLFIEDEAGLIDVLNDRGVPAIHLDEVADLTDTELADLLDYSRTSRLKQWHERHRAATEGRPREETHHR